MFTAMIDIATTTTVNTCDLETDFGVRLLKFKPNSISYLGKLLKLPKIYS